jgi:hypothetical protein
MQMLGLSIAIVVAAVVVVNASFMLLSPKAWFRLPAWILLRGTLTEKKYGAGWGGIQVRILGAILLGTVVWMVYGSFTRR